MPVTGGSPQCRDVGDLLYDGSREKKKGLSGDCPKRTRPSKKEKLEGEEEKKKCESWDRERKAVLLNQGGEQVGGGRCASELFSGAPTLFPNFSANFSTCRMKIHLHRPPDLPLWG